jgi:hypothetical protein
MDFWKAQIAFATTLLLPSASITENLAISAYYNLLSKLKPE